MGRPSEPLLAWLRERIKAKNLNTAVVADKAGMPRTKVRKVLAGREPMMVDDLLALCEAMGLTPADMGLPDPGGAAEAEPEGPVMEVAPDEPAAPSAGDGIDPYGNHPQQLLEIGVALGCDFMLLVDTSLLTGSGVPPQVLDRYRNGELPIKLDAAYHHHINPRYDDECVTLTLGFDALYECRFPWPSVRRIIFYPEPPQIIEDLDEDDEAPGPFLRLVE